jgi:hypothetical protein
MQQNAAVVVLDYLHYRRGLWVVPPDGCRDVALHRSENSGSVREEFAKRSADQLAERLTNGIRQLHEGFPAFCQLRNPFRPLHEKLPECTMKHLLQHIITYHDAVCML